MVAYGTEKPRAYRPRLVDERLQRLLSTFGAVEIRGTKWCGKSWAALAFGESVVHLDDPNVKALAEADPMLALQGAHPHVVDEWQEVPSTWDATRRAVDAAGGERGLFILTVCFATLILRFSRHIFFGFHVLRQGRATDFPNFQTCPS